jgi:GDP-D-mannose 3', 5'-epimerase
MGSMHLIVIAQWIALTCCAPARSVTYFWIKSQIEKETAKGTDMSAMAKSMVVGTMAPTDLGSLRAGDGKEGLTSKQ